MFNSVQDTQEREIVPGFQGRFYHGQVLTLARWTVAAGSQLPPHAHHHEQVTSVIRGQFEMTIDGETRILEEGDTAVILANQQHSGRALTDCLLVDAFSPVREDYR